MNGWIKHNGSGMPVLGSTKVYVKLENDKLTFKNFALPANDWGGDRKDSNWRWSFDFPRGSEIIEYKIAD